MLNATWPCVTALILTKLSAIWTGFTGGKLANPARLSTLLLVAVFGAYAAHWLTLHGGFLFLPELQNDDARTALFPFHRYGLNPILASDPIAREMMAYVTPGLWLLYRCLAPVTNLYIASKCVQGLALGILILAGCVLVRSRRAGLAPGLLLIFLVLSDSYAVGRIAGGHARAFAFPCFALWVAGVLSARRSARIAAPLIGALFYPAVMLMILAAEGFYSVRGFWRRPLPLVARRLRRFVLLATACVALSLPSVIGGDRSRGPVHSLQQAQQEPAFYGNGRLGVLPLGKPTRELTSAFLARFSASGHSLWAGRVFTSTEDGVVGALCALSLLIVFRLLGWVSVPNSVNAFVLGSLALYFAARLFAFRLYSTERYYAYGMRMVSCLLLTAVASQFMGYSRRLRGMARNLLATVVILSSWLFLGDGIIRNNGMTLDARWDADLYRFIRTLPLTARFASHPLDGDGIPYYAARATNGTFETLQPWFLDSWRRQKTREFETFNALYCSKFEDVLAYGEKYAVSHLLLNRERYGEDWKQHVSSFEPFTAYAVNLANQSGRELPALTHVPDAAVVFDRPPWKIVDLARLRLTIRN